MNVVELNTGRRWRACVTYRRAEGLHDVVYHAEEIADVHELIEQGPSFSTIERIEITLNRLVDGAPRTLEEAIEAGEGRLVERVAPAVMQ